MPRRRISAAALIENSSPVAIVTPAKKTPQKLDGSGGVSWTDREEGTLKRCFTQIFRFFQLILKLFVA